MRRPRSSRAESGSHSDRSTEQKRPARDDDAPVNGSTKSLDVDSMPQSAPRHDLLSLDEFIHWREGCLTHYVFDDFRAWARKNNAHGAKLKFDRWKILYRQYKLEITD